MNPADVPYFYNPDNMSRLFIRLSECILGVCEGLLFRLRVAAYAITCLRRFYLCPDITMAHFDPRLIMATCLFLSIKSNGCHCNPQSLLLEILKQKSIAFPYSLSAMVQAEPIVLSVLANMGQKFAPPSENDELSHLSSFSLNHFTTELCAFEFLPDLLEPINYDTYSTGALISIAHAIIVDLYKTEVVVMFSAKEIAIAAVHLALSSQALDFQPWLEKVLSSEIEASKVLSWIHSVQTESFAEDRSDWDKKQRFMMKLRVQYITASYIHFTKTWRLISRLNDHKSTKDINNGALILPESDLEMNAPRGITFKYPSAIGKMYEEETFQTTLWDAESCSFFIPPENSPLWTLFQSNSPISQGKNTKKRADIVSIRDLRHQQPFIFNCRLGLTDLFTVLNYLNTIPTIVKPLQ